MSGRRVRLQRVVDDINRRLDPAVDPALDEDTARLYAGMPREALRVLRAAFIADRDQSRRPSLITFAQIRIDYITALLGEPPREPHA